MGGPRPLRIATRGSPLARWQADLVAERLAATGVAMPELVVVETTGDRLADRPIHEIGGQGVFAAEVRAAVLDGRADLAVHSAKDLPSAELPGLVMACVPDRDDPRDALVGTCITDLAPGAVIATGSVRRRAQLAAHRPDLTFVELRGNIGTRLERVPEGGAIVMALAALRRLGLERSYPVDVLDESVVLPQVAQGALAVECRTGDEQVLAALAPLEDAAARRAVDAERAFLAAIGGGCDLPVGALATPVEGAAATRLRLRALLASLDGRVVLRAEAEGDDPGALGRSLAQELLVERGGDALLAGLRPVEPGGEGPASGGRSAP